MNNLSSLSYQKILTKIIRNIGSNLFEDFFIIGPKKTVLQKNINIDNNN